jgi:hypothetical protein
MPNNQIAIDTIAVLNYCLDGYDCVNHNHGIIDTTFYYYANVGASKTYFKVMPSEMDNSVNCDNLYKDIFGNIFYLEPEIKQIENVMEAAKLTSFDSIKVGDKVFPAPTPFVPRYFTHKETPLPVQNNTEMVFDTACFSVLVLATIGYAIRVAANNSWSKLWNDIISA